MASTIKLKNGSGAPTAGDLVQGEPALDLTNKRLYTEDSGGTVLEIGTNPTSLTTGTFTSTGIDDNATSTAITIDSSENVGIGEASPLAKLQVSGANNGDVFYVTSSDVPDDRGLMFSNSSNGIVWDIDAKGASSSFGELSFSTNGTERMRIDSSGNLLVGKTASGIANSGVELTPNDRSAFTKSNGSPILANRTTSDGAIIDFRKDGTTVGSIGVNAGSIAFGQSNTAIGAFNTDRILFPATASGGVQDNAIDLGYSNGRFKDLYLSGGVYLGGTGAANKLDDYEEGTWTPVFANLTGVSSAGGSYVKIGNLVTVSVEIISSGTTTITLNSSRITNLPFTISLAGGGRYVGSFTDVSASSGLYGTHTISGTTAIFTSSVSTGGIVSGSLTYRVS